MLSLTLYKVEGPGSLESGFFLYAPVFAYLPVNPNSGFASTILMQLKMEYLQYILNIIKYIYI